MIACNQMVGESGPSRKQGRLTCAGKGETMENTILVNEWDSDEFHRRVMELQSAGYTSRQESYHILADVNPETGEILHLHTIEMLKDDTTEG